MTSVRVLIGRTILWFTEEAHAQSRAGRPDDAASQYIDGVDLGGEQAAV